MNSVEWLVGFVGTFDIVALVLLIGYLIRRRAEIFEIEYSFVLACAVFLFGTTISRLAMFYLLWPERHLPYYRMEEYSPVGASHVVDIGILLTSVGAVLIVRFIGRLLWDTEWLWIGTAIVAAGIPPLADWLSNFSWW